MVGDSDFMPDYGMADSNAHDSPEHEPTDEEKKWASFWAGERRREEIQKCPYLWPKSAAKFQARSDAILEPIREAVRARGVWRLIIRHAKTSEEKEAVRQRIVDILEYRLPVLEQQLGRLLLSAVLEGDKDFPEVVSAALKDANRLFHRGKILDGFFKWRHALPQGGLRKMTVGEIQDAFVVYLGRDELAGGEWKRIVEEFALSEVPRGKPGPKPKKKRRN